MPTIIAVVRRCLAIASLGLLSACSTSPDDRARLSEQWELQRWVIDGEAKPLAPNVKKPTLTISEDGTISGSSSVNRYKGSVSLSSPGELSISSKIMTTRRAGPPAAMDQEMMFLSLLPQMQRYSFVGDVLRLDGEQSWLEFVLAGAE